MFYFIYLVKRYGGTPGKLIVGLRIRKVDGTPVGYREAILRYFPDAIFRVLASVAAVLGALHLSDAEFYAHPFWERIQSYDQVFPSWYKLVQWAQNIWVWSELVVLLTNQKRRALHDFLAGTVVVHTAPIAPPPPATTSGPNPDFSQ